MACYCRSEHAAHRDVQVFDMTDESPADYPAGKPWMAVTADNLATFFDTEAAVCEFQRHWRVMHGLDPITGEFAA